MKKALIILIIIIVLAGITAGIVLLAQKIQENNNPINNEIVVDNPKPNQIISSPLEITGKARGSWYFEASFPVFLLDGNGNELARIPAQAQGDWMTDDFVDFKVTLIFFASPTADGFLILKNDNPSGLPQNDKQIEIPVKFQDVQTTTVQAFFSNNALDPQISCNKVFPAERTIPKTEAVGRAAIEELLKGPTEQEKASGYFTSINTGVEIQSLTIENNVAKIDFNDQLEFQVGGSCRVAAIRTQITKTLEQFSTVKSVIISINNRTEDILQP